MDDADGMDEIERRLAEAGREFLAAVWPQLEADRVVPLPAFHPYIEVGRDYFGDQVMWLLEYRALVEAITSAHSRFDPQVPLMEREFPGGLVFSFLETFVARLTISGEDFSSDGSAADQAVRELIHAARADTFEVACCRVVSHMTTTTGEPIDFDGVRVTPVVSDAAGHSGTLNRLVSEVIPGAMSAYGRDDPAGFAPPESVVSARASDAKPFELGQPLSQRIERFLMLARLLKPGTSESMFEVRGETHPVRQFKPTMSRFRGAGPSYLSPTQLAARVIELGPADVSRIGGLGRLLAATEDPSPGMLFTSFGMAWQKFLLSFHAHSWHEQIVDLATAFEATLSGKAKDDVTLRLRVRASTLLCTARDPADAIFKDVGLIYGLRSGLVHGGALTEKSVLKDVRKISTVPEAALAGDAVAYAVERLRDLVRRSLLARICLASHETSLWPLDTDDGVDAVMVDDSQRQAWRQAWRDTLASIDALAAADRPQQRASSTG